MQNELNLNNVDLIYLDPPFNSNRNYNAIYKDETGRPLPDQIEAFCDIWTLDRATRSAIRNLDVIFADRDIEPSILRFWKTWMLALADTNPKLLAYLYYMVERLAQMKLVLKPTGSIYLHCDPTYSHYIKVVMDGIFGHQNFRNEIIWSYQGTGEPKNAFKRKHDVIFFYGKSKHAFFSTEDSTEPISEFSKSKYTKEDENGKYKEIRHKDGSIHKQYMRSHQRIRDVWEIPVINANANERMGYPTQKPLKLLDRIIKASSNEGDVVLDPFCGCGTTLEAAQKLNRKWIGIDIAFHAIKRVSSIRLQERCELVENTDYGISGVPQTLEAAEHLWHRDPYHFQTWAVAIVDGFVTARRSHDGGVDGRLYFHDDEDTKAMKIEVKGGATIRINDLRALAGVIDEEDYPMGGFITRKTLGRVQKQNFLDFCNSKGTVEIRAVAYPRLQILSVEEIFEGKRFYTPLVRGRSTTDQMNLFGEET